MSSIFPLRDTVSHDEQGGPRLVDLDEETADEVFKALSAQTTRRIFLSLHEQPQTASDLAKETDTSVQNVQYHLKKLQEAELIDDVDTWYSERGSEMTVYAPTDESLVLFAGQDKERSLRSLFNRFVGVIGALLPVTLIVGFVTSLYYSGESGPAVGDLTADDDDATAEDDSVDARSADDDPDGDAGATGGDADPDTEQEESEESPADDDSGFTAETTDDSPDEEPEQDEVEDSEAVQDDTPEESEESADGDLSGEEVNLSGEEADVFVDNETVEEPVIVTDGGNVTEVSQAALEGTTDVAGLDPALAAAVAFFCGGLFVATALFAWYGIPDW